jgi:hypothetical protein
MIVVALLEPPKIHLGTPEGKAAVAARLQVSLLGNPAVPVDVLGTSGLRYDDNAKAFSWRTRWLNRFSPSASPRVRSDGPPGNHPDDERLFPQQAGPCPA